MSQILEVSSEEPRNLELKEGETAELSFEAWNRADGYRGVGYRVVVMNAIGREDPLAPQLAWFTTAGPADPLVAVGASATCKVSVTVPAGADAQKVTFALMAYDHDLGDEINALSAHFELTVPAPPVPIDVPTPEPKEPPPWWIWLIVGGAALAVVVVVLILVFGGETCESAELDCGAHGTCSTDSGEPACDCQAGWSGPACGSCATGYHASGQDCVQDTLCAPDSCSSHGSCNDSSGSPACTCFDGYAGATCGQCDQGYQANDLGNCVIIVCSSSLPNQGNDWSTWHNGCSMDYPICDPQPGQPACRKCQTAQECPDDECNSYGRCVSMD